MPRPKGDLGWVENPVEVDAQTVLMGGDAIIFGNSEFKGIANRKIAAGVKGVFPHLAEKKLFGSFKNAFYQRRGTCVGQGTTRALQDSLYNQIANHGLVSRKAEIAVAPIYAGARIEIGRGQISGDGAVGAWAASYVHKKPLVARQVYGTFDLSKQNGDESYAVSWGTRGNGVPKVVSDAGEATVICFRCMSQDDIADAAFAGFALAFCGRYTYSGKNASGIARLSSPANHCTEAVGVAVTKDGNVLIGGQQSWGDDTPAGPSILKYADGEVELRPGMCFVPIEDYYKVMKSSGEMWAFQIVKGFRPRSAADL